MKLFKKTILSTLIGMTVVAGSAQAGPKPNEIERLSTDLTPVGAIRAGNAEGTIPAWTGGITSSPAGYQVGDHHPDPFAADKVSFTIDASNYKQHSEKLSVGQMAMF